MKDYNTLSSFIDNIQDCVIIINNRGVILQANTAVSRLLGYEHEELIGSNVSMLMGRPHHMKHDKYIHHHQHTKDTTIIGKGREVVAVTKSGKKIPVRLNVSEMTLDNQNAYVGILYDLSHHRSIDEHIQEANTALEKDLQEANLKLSQTIQELTQSKLKLEQKILEVKLANTKLEEAQSNVKQALEKERELNELKSQFISTASHEFRTPLSSILSSSSLIERYTTTATNDRRLKHTQRIKSLVRHLTQILNDFLSLSKLDEGKLDSKKQLFDLSRLVTSVIEELSITTKHNQQFDYKHSGLSNIYSNNQDIKNILINLCSNAIKYSDENSTIYIRTTITKDKTILSVRDEGIGIPVQQQRYLFERFFRAENAINIQGTGLGLYIVKKYVEHLQGTIEFESKETVGTKFSVSIPNYNI